MCKFYDHHTNQTDQSEASETVEDFQSYSNAKKEKTSPLNDVLLGKRSLQAFETEHAKLGKAGPPLMQRDSVYSNSNKAKSVLIFPLGRA